MSKIDRPKPDTLNEFLSNLNHPLKEEVQRIRKTVLGAHTQLEEHIKWNAPSYIFDGDDRITFNLRGVDHFLLIFHRGAKVKSSKKKGRLIDDHRGLLEWAADDRAVLRIDKNKMSTVEKVLPGLVQDWLRACTND
jgi:uncharacterized protein YdeI (YjbR/CyaY-like superfamily)